MSISLLLNRLAIYKFLVWNYSLLGIVRPCSTASLLLISSCSFISLALPIASTQVNETLSLPKPMPIASQCSPAIETLSLPKPMPFAAIGYTDKLISGILPENSLTEISEMEQQKEKWAQPLQVSVLLCSNKCQQARRHSSEHFLHL